MEEQSENKISDVMQLRKLLDHAQSVNQDPVMTIIDVILFRVQHFSRCLNMWREFSSMQLFDFFSKIYDFPKM